MRKLRVETVIPIVFLLFAAFVLGFMAQDVTANGLDVKGWISSLQLLPQRLENVGKSSTLADSQSLPLIETYSSVMERVKSDYYGKPVNERELTYNAIRGMLVALDDPFTRFMDPDEYKEMREDNEGNFTGIGAQLDTNKKGEVFIKEPLPDTPAIRAGLKSNDVIIAVDDKPIANLEIDAVVKMIRGPEGTKVKISVSRPGREKTMDFNITREIVQFQIVKTRMIDDKTKIGYIRLYKFNEQTDTQFDLALTELDKQHMKGLVFDLRGNPGGLLQMAVDIGSRFVESGPVVTIQERGGRKTPLFVETDKHNHKQVPLVVLVDKGSASASEIVSGAIKDTGSGTLVGMRTFGKGRVQTIMPLQDGSAIAIVTAKYLTPNGIDIHKKGIEPDIVVEASENFDPNDPATDIQLDKAIDVLKVKMGISPKSVLDKLKQQTAKIEKAEQEAKAAAAKEAK